MNINDEQTLNHKTLNDSAALHLLEQAMGFTFQAALRTAAQLGGRIV